MKYILPVMIPFLLGWALALLSYGPADRMSRSAKLKKLHITRERLSVLIILVITFLTCLGIWLALRSCAGGISALLQTCAGWEDDMHNMVNDCCQTLEQVTGITAANSRMFIYERVEDCKNMAAEYLGSREFVDETMTSVKCVFLLVSMGLISVVFGILLAKDYERYREVSQKSEFLQRFWKVIRELGLGLRSYLRAQIKIMGVISALCMGGLYLMGQRHFIWWGLLIGLVDALPVLGAGMVLVPWAVWTFLQGQTEHAFGLLALFALAAILRQILEPKWIGRDLGIQPLFVLAAIYLGVVVYGGSGFILGPISGLLLMGLIREWKGASL